MPTEQVVGGAIQKLMAARLGRAFLPLGVLFAFGFAGLLRGSPGAFGVALGAVAAGGAMLGYGLRVVQRTLGRPRRVWMLVASAASVVPPLYALYVLGWRGLRAMAEGGGSMALLVGAVHFVLGVWVLRSWMRVLELERLARIMTMGSDHDGGSPR